jgi:superfamily II DNA/RNA helicase
MIRLHKVIARETAKLVDIIGYKHVRDFDSKHEAENYISRRPGRWAIDGRLYSVANGRVREGGRLPGLMKELNKSATCG